MGSDGLQVVLNQLGALPGQRSASDRPRSDCATVNEMIKYSKSENERMRNLIPVGIDDPQKYAARSQRAGEALQAACPT